jgi:F-type H+-transporting ATPase subunit epsilon
MTKMNPPSTWSARLTKLNNMIKFKIATPERVMLDIEVESVTLPSSTGEVTILPNHIPLVSNLSAGEIKYIVEGKEQFFVIAGGVLEVKSDNQVVVLADAAEFGHEIDEKRAEEARERAKKAMSETFNDDKAFASAAAGLEKHLARLRVVRKHRTRTNKNLESGVLHE